MQVPTASVLPKTESIMDPNKRANDVSKNVTLKWVGDQRHISEVIMNIQEYGTKVRLAKLQQLYPKHNGQSYVC